MSLNKSVMICLTCTIASAGSMKGGNRLIDGHEQYRLLIKIKADQGTILTQGKPELTRAANSRTESINSIFSGLHFNQLIQFSGEEIQAIRSGRAGSKGTGFDKSQFSGLLELQGSSLMPKAELLSLANRLETLDEVEYCQLAPVSQPSFESAVSHLNGSPRATVNSWLGEQFYLYGVDKSNSNISGIFADWAWSQGITGQGVKVADIEWGWDFNHDEFNNKTKFISGIETPPTTSLHHGTAVLGVMLGGDNGFGISGACHGADRFYGFSELPKGREFAVLQALDSLEAGDVLVYEMQSFGTGAGYVPADYEKVVWDATKAATDAGIIVVAAAGNGRQNLDDPIYSSYMGRGDNGSIIVGGATKVARYKVADCTYGSRIDVVGFADGYVTTTGFGDLYSNGQDIHSDYTSGFNGTSAATPVVASAVVLIQSYAKTKLGKIVSPRDMRSLLKATGTPGGMFWGTYIPSLPNVQAAITKLIADSGSTVVGDTYEVTVANGTGDGVYKTGSLVTVTADDPKEGFIFSGWSGDISVLQDAMKSPATFTVGTKSVSLTATYIRDIVSNIEKQNSNIITLSMRMRKSGELQLTIPESGIYTVTLYSLAGKKIYERTQCFATGSAQVLTDVQAAGFYIGSVRGDRFGVTTKMYCK